MEASSSSRSENRRPIPELRRFKEGHAVIRETFDPYQELHKIKAGPRSERRESIIRFKEQFMTQREAWAECRIAIENRLKSNPDTPRKELLDMVDQFGNAYGFGGYERELACDILDSFYESRLRMLEIRAQFPDKVDLVNHLTGRSFPKETQFEVLVGPMSIDIFADEEAAQKIYKDTDSITQETLDYAGFASQSRDGVFYNVMVGAPGPDTEDTVVHERQHQTNKLFQNLFDTHSDNYSSYLEDETDSEMKRAFLEPLFTSEKETALNRARDEMFATITDSKRMNLKPLFVPESKLYDYTKPVREKYKDDPVGKELAQQILVDDYQREIGTGADALQALSRVYGTDRATALLSATPLRDWSKFSARVYQQKLDDPTIHAGEVRAIEIKRQEDARKRQVLKDLIAKHATTVPVAVAGVAGAVGVLNAPREGHTIHESMRNIHSFEGTNASYRIVYGNKLLEANPRSIEGSDAVVIGDVQVRSAEEASEWYSKKDNMPVSLNGFDLFALNRFNGGRVEPHYGALVEAATKQKLPLYLLDMVDTETKTPDERRKSHDIQGLLEASLGIVLAASGAHDFRKSPTRRSVLTGLTKIFGGLYLGSDTVQMAVHGLSPYEPDTNSTQYQADKSLKAFNRAVHPEFKDNALHEMENILTAQKTESMAAALQEQLGKRPVITVLVDRARAGLEDAFGMSEEERLKRLGAFFKEDLATQSNRYSFEHKRGRIRTRRIVDSSLTRTVGTEAPSLLQENRGK